MLDNIWIDQMAANLWILWIITHSSKASIKWWPIDGSINCPAQSIDCPDPSIVRDIYMITSIYLFIYLSIYLSISLSIYQSINIYMSCAFDGSVQSIDCAGHLIDRSMGHHLINALLEWVIIHSIHRLAAI